MNATNPTDQVQSIFQGEDTMKKPLLIEDFDCGLILGVHDLYVDCEITEDDINISWAKVQVNPASPAKEGIDILALVQDMRVFHNMIIDAHEEAAL